MDHVAGYTILNDVSDREYTGQKDSHRLINWFFMKGQDTFAPLGPCLVSKDEIADPHKLRLRLWVNGELRQDSEGEEMIFKIPQILSRVSQFVTLEPGDIVSTGNPRGHLFQHEAVFEGWRRGGMRNRGNRTAAKCRAGGGSGLSEKIRTR